MRITTGLYKGRIIATVRDLSVRPATDRVRQTLFNILTHRMNLEGIRVLDLFAGSGSLGLEALSRGAAHATFVESSAHAIHHLEQNLRSLGCQDAATVLQMDALRYVERTNQTYALVFADPPYRYERTADIPFTLFERAILPPGGYALIEHAADLHFTPTDRYAVGPEKKFGRTVVTFFQPISTPDQG